jgi:hypothetical protein
MPDGTKKRGRPALSEEEREARRIAHNQKTNERHKANGYASQKRCNAAYREAHRGEIYEPKLRIPSSKKGELQDLISKTGLTLTQLFVGAVEEKYGVILHEDIDK